jgi:hypothetical protein
MTDLLLSTDAIRTVVDGLAHQDFHLLVSATTDDVELRALLPGGVLVRHGYDAVRTAFEGWFGNTRDFELVESSADDVADVVDLGWRVRARAARFAGDGWYVAQQRGFAHLDAEGRIRLLSLVCSGFRPESAV